MPTLSLAQMVRDFGSPERRVSIFYLTLYMAMGVAVPFLPLWLQSKGFAQEDIGILNALPIWIMVLVTIFVGRLADRAPDWRQAIIWCAVCAGLIPILLLVTQGVWPTIIVWSLGMLPFMVITPIVDAATIRFARRRGADFARIRAYGTLGYVLLSLSSGTVLAVFGIAWFLYLFIGFSLLRMCVAFFLPAFRQPDAAQESIVPQQTAHAAGAGVQAEDDQTGGPKRALKLSHFFRPWFLCAVMGGAIGLASHGPFYSFGSILWDQQGISKSMIGPLWALGSAAEIVTFLLFGRIARRFSARHLLLFALLMTMLRWGGMMFELPLYGYVILQLLHAFSFGLTYLGALNFVANWTSESFSAEAQSTFQVISQALQALFIFVFGYIFAQFGAISFLTMVVMSGIGALFVLLSLFLVNPYAETKIPAS